VLRDPGLSRVDVTQLVADADAARSERHAYLMGLSDEELFEEALREGGGG
jgi:hypothetical protein